MSNLRPNKITRRQSRNDMKKEAMTFWDVALDPGYPKEEVKQVTKEEVAKAFGLREPMQRLNKALGSFGLEQIASDMEDQFLEFAEREAKWAEDVRYYWWATAPYETTNLRHSITINDKQFPKKIDVLVDRDILLRFAGMRLKGWRVRVADEIPYRKYLGAAEKNNKSAARRPGSARESIHDFTTSVWETYAYDKRKKELFS